MTRAVQWRRVAAILAGGQRRRAETLAWFVARSGVSSCGLAWPMRAVVLATMHPNSNVRAQAKELAVALPGASSRG